MTDVQLPAIAENQFWRVRPFMYEDGSRLSSVWRAAQQFGSPVGELKYPTHKITLMEHKPGRGKRKTIVEVRAGVVYKTLVPETHINGHRQSATVSYELDDECLVESAERVLQVVKFQQEEAERARALEEAHTIALKRNSEWSGDYPPKVLRGRA